MWNSLEISSQRLLPLDGFKQGFEIPLAKKPRSLALNDFVEYSRPILNGLSEDLQEIALIIPIDKNIEIL